MTAVIPDPAVVIPDPAAVIPDPAVVIPDPAVVIPDSIRDPLPRHHWIAGAETPDLIDNTDDHEKNHVLLMADSGEYELSPAFDVLPSGQALGYQQMRVGASGADSTLENALSECEQFGMKKAEAADQVKKVCAVVATWKEHFARAGVLANDIESLSGQIDRPFLLDQRRD
jgi:hypothetical protein